MTYDAIMGKILSHRHKMKDIKGLLDEFQKYLLLSGGTLTGDLILETLLKTDQIIERTENAGVTIEDILFKDGEITIFPNIKYLKFSPRSFLTSWDGYLCIMEGAYYDAGWHNISPTGGYPIMVWYDDEWGEIHWEFVKFTGGTTWDEKMTLNHYGELWLRQTGDIAGLKLGSNAKLYSPSGSTLKTDYFFHAMGFKVFPLTKYEQILATDTAGYGKIGDQNRRLATCWLEDGNFLTLIATENLTSPRHTFDTNDYMDFDKTNNRYLFYIGGTIVGYIDSTGFNNGSPP